MTLSIRLKKEIVYLKLLFDQTENIEIIKEQPLTFDRGPHILRIV